VKFILHQESSTQLVLQINFTRTKTDRYLLIHGHAAICTKLHCLFKAVSTRKKHDFLQVPCYYRTSLVITGTNAWIWPL